MEGTNIWTRGTSQRISTLERSLPSTLSVIMRVWSVVRRPQCRTQSFRSMPEASRLSLRWRLIPLGASFPLPSATV
jgi:hypothetical protein